MHSRCRQNRATLTDAQLGQLVRPDDVTCCGRWCICTEMSPQASPSNLPSGAYVSLAETLSWIAFGDAMSPDDLRAQVEGHRLPITDSPEERLRNFFAGHDEDVPEIPGLGYFHERRAGLEKLTHAWLQLRDEVGRGTVKLRGRHAPIYSLADACMANVVELTGDLLATFSQFDVSTGGVRRQPVGSPDVIWQGDPYSFDREFESFAGDARATEGYLMVEVERGDVIRRWPRPVKVRRKSHDEVVAWCKHWIESGQGNGMDKAWPVFHADPANVGLSRDHVFRPAWNEAKAL